MPSAVIFAEPNSPSGRLTFGSSTLNVVEPESTVMWIVTVTSIPMLVCSVVIWLPVKFLT